MREDLPDSTEMMSYSLSKLSLVVVDASVEDTSTAFQELKGQILLPGVLELLLYAAKTLPLALRLRMSSIYAQTLSRTQL
jgi:hypothetical protein